jgi:2-C-methyl-D-erythritol 4-phosphate cytidylyltransferase
MRSLRELLGAKRKKDFFCSAVIVAAGSASRMNMPGNKVLMQIGDRPCLAWCLEQFDMCRGVGEIIVVAREEEIFDVAAVGREFNIKKLKRIVKGGETRLLSVLAGIAEVNEKAALIAIHDGARPVVPARVIEETVAAAAEVGAAAPGLGMTDTVKEADPEGFILRTVPRETLFSVQTPQIFDAGLIKGALEKAAKDGAEITDDCMAVERLGIRVKMTEGSSRNIKITTASDLAVAETLLEMEAVL